MKFVKYLFSSKLFILGLFIRLLVMPFTAHYDLRGINFAVYQLPFNGVTNIYEVAQKGPVDYLVNINFGREYFIYPPLTYFTLGGIMTALKPLYGTEFVSWIQGYGNDTLSVITHPHVFRYLFLMKIPYLIFDILMLFGLFKFARTIQEQKYVMAFWWLNPITIYLPYIWGQFDIIPASLTVLALYVLAKRPHWGTFILGIAASYKSYPLMLLPLIVLARAKTWRQALTMTLVGLAPFALTTLPYAGHEFFRSTVLVSWQSQKMLDFMWGIGGDTGIYPFVIGYTLIAFWTFSYARVKQNSLVPIIMSLLLYFATTNFHQQWFLWVLPFLLIYSLKNISFRPIFYTLIALFFLRLISLQGNVTTELFLWIAPAIDDLPKTRYLVGLVYDIHKVRNIVASFYVAISVWVMYYFFKKGAS